MGLLCNEWVKSKLNNLNLSTFGEPWPHELINKINKITENYEIEYIYCTQAYSGSHVIAYC